MRALSVSKKKTEEGQSLRESLYQRPEEPFELKLYEIEQYEEEEE